MKMYAHRVTKRYYDYGTFVEAVEGLGWTVNSGGEAKGYVMGFEEGDFAKLLADKRAALAAMGSKLGSSIHEGEPVERRVDMNPHGLI